MPFTGSHPAAVLPFFRFGLVPTALVIGSMVPDLPYYLPIPVDPGTTHSLAGTLTVDIGLGAAVYAVWLAVLAPFLAALVRLDLPMGGRRRVPLVLLSLAVGAATHSLWDAFTHAGRWGPRHIAWLAEQHGALPGYRWAQYASGIVGAVVIGGWLLRWWRRHRPVDRTAPGMATRTVWIVAAVIALAAVVGALVAAVPAVNREGLLRIVFLAGTGGVGGALVAASVCGGWWRLTRSSV